MLGKDCQLVALIVLIFPSRILRVPSLVISARVKCLEFYLITQFEPRQNLLRQSYSDDRSAFEGSVHNAGMFSCATSC